MLSKQKQVQLGEKWESKLGRLGWCVEKVTDDGDLEMLTDRDEYVHYSSEAALINDLQERCLMD